VDQLALMNRLVVLMMGRFPCQPVDATFVFGRAQRDYEATEGDSGILETAAELYHKKLTHFLSLPGTKGKLAVGGVAVMTTYPGPEVFSRCLEERGVPVDRIVPTAEAPPHTRGDSDAFVELAKDRAWSTAVVVTQPHQMLRAMLGVLKSFEKYAYPMQVLPVCPRCVNWNKNVYGSQGALLLKRHEHVQQEWGRITRFQEKGDLASLEELNSYLSLSLL